MMLVVVIITSTALTVPVFLSSYGTDGLKPTLSCGTHMLRSSNFGPRLQALIHKKEASTVLCSVVKHAGSGRALKKCRRKQGM